VLAHAPDQFWHHGWNPLGPYHADRWTLHCSWGDNRAPLWEGARYYQNESRGGTRTLFCFDLISGAFRSAALNLIPGTFLVWWKGAGYQKEPMGTPGHLDRFPPLAREMAQRYQVADDSPLTADEAAMGCEKRPLESVLVCFWVCVFLSLSWQIESSFLSDNNF
jgi:hypothetical protein